MAETHLYKPKRHLRNEIYSLALVLAAPLGIAAAFPYAALAFKAREAPAESARASCAFISLPDEQADAAVQAARASIKTARDGMSALRADLSLGAIPRETRCVAQIGERRGVVRQGDVDFPYTPLPHSQAAAKPEKIAADPAATNAPCAFTREDLLAL